MCLAIPMQITHIDGFIAHCAAKGVEREVSLFLLQSETLQEGDYILIHDAGAYTLSMWSRYNSRQMPKVIGYRSETDKFEVLKERENLEALQEFWS